MSFAGTTPSAAPLVRNTIRAIGIAGLVLVGLLVAGVDVFAHAPAGTGGYGPALALPSSAYLFGTDELGRDVFSETLHALSVTVNRALIGMAIVVVAGELFGFAAARLPWWLGESLRWLARVLGATPALLLAILMIAIAGVAFAPVAVGLAAVPLAFSRAFDRASSTDRAANAAYARATGIPPATLFRRDLVYEFRGALLPIAARAFGAAAIILSTAEFFGFGGTPPARGLGLMIAAARPYYLSAWWTAAFPALALLILLLLARMAASLEEGERP